MKNKWSQKKADYYIRKYGQQWGKDLALRTYSSRLIGSDKELVLPGGGNTSVKGEFSNILGKKIPAIFVKASGYNLATIEPEGHCGLDLEYLQGLENADNLSDEVLVNQMRTHLFDWQSPTPSMETLIHAFIPERYIDHTHADAILTLNNQSNGKELIQKIFGKKIIIVDYIKPGFNLSIAAIKAFRAAPGSEGMVLMKHGLITWGKSARESYERTIEMVTRAEEFIAKNESKPIKTKLSASVEKAKERYEKIAPTLRGALALSTGNPDWPYRRFILRPIISKEVLNLVNSERGKEITLTSPLTTDYLIRTKAFPLWLQSPQLENPDKLNEQISIAIRKYEEEYTTYFQRNSKRLTSKNIRAFDPRPRVLLIPELGAVCVGKDVTEADMVKDITTQTLYVKSKIASLGGYEGLSEDHLFDMEYSSIQHAKLKQKEELLLQRSVALITGAAGAIGSGISQLLLEQGCQVAVTDLPGKNLDSCVNELKKTFAEQVTSVPIDVTDTKSVQNGFKQVIHTWGGIDLIVSNAGLAHVSSLAEMDPVNFQRLSKVNINGTLNVIAEAARFFKIQGTGGDIILISTKNVFAPGARFGAYSATKAAAHQLARIASLELAGIGVRVNMVSPDAIFSHDKRKSGLWLEVGPDRMRARGLDEKGLEEYYQKRNLLKAKITATHVAKAVLFFATHQTPTTGATIPVDGGLPDATPR